MRAKPGPAPGFARFRASRAGADRARGLNADA